MTVYVDNGMHAMGMVQEVAVKQVLSIDALRVRGGDRVAVYERGV
eukprot:CAMPEP_0119090518 /NCGR_PEP_ID=MMETSP1178-20130426/152991_1 /TAXON_ID=33656 /ORGANISM="unid sp, Strain CCMP2000" /LENGTH=44 /DNA_ID= /DNA_START= /DNA_END= /DNA_ORIENTATION=